MTKFENITLIGMPGSGKSTIGKVLAQELNFNFIDTDKYIENEEGRSLQEIIDSYGNEKFCEIEERRIVELFPLKNHIISPGGSVIYSEKLMKIFKRVSILIFLDLPLDIIKKRLDNKEKRGIVRFETLSISELYKERVPLYKKHAKIVIKCGNLSPSAIVNLIIDRVK